MASKLLEFALKKGSANEQIENIIPSSESDEITQRLEAELAQLPGDTNDKNGNRSNLFDQSKQFNYNKNVGIYPQPKLPDPSKISQITIEPPRTSAKLGNNQQIIDNNNNKITTQTEKTTAPSSNTEKKYDQPIPSKTHEQIEKEVTNPIVKEEDNSSKIWKCDECGTKLKARFTLEMHINTKHKHIKGFACTLCDHKSAQRANLNVHMMATHNQTEKFQCNLCVKLLEGKREIGNHIKSEHGRTSSPSLFTSVYVTFIEP